MQCKDYWKPILINVVIVYLLIFLCVVHQHRRLYFTGWTESGTTDPPLRKLPVLLKDSPQHTRRMFDLCMRVSEFSRTPLFWLPWCLRPWGGPRLGSICHNEFWRETNWIQGCTITHKCAACHKSLMVRIRRWAITTILNDQGCTLRGKFTRVCVKKGSCYLQEEGFCLEARLHLHRLMQQPRKGRFYALLYNDSLRLNVFSNCFTVKRKELYNLAKSHNGLGSVKEVIRIGKMCPSIFSAKFPTGRACFSSCKLFSGGAHGTVFRTTVLWHKTCILK